MALHPENPYWIPAELLVTIVKFLPVRCRRALMCVSKEHGNVIDMWRDKTYGSFWLTEEQETLVSEILREPRGIVHLKAPPSTGKTGIVLAAALGKGGFVPEGDILLVAVASGLVGVWASEIARMFPSKKVLKVCSGGVSYQKGIQALKAESLKETPYDVVIATPVWAHHYLLQKALTGRSAARTIFPYDDNMPIRWVILDEAHRDGTTKTITTSVKEGAYKILQFIILLTANNVDIRYSKKIREIQLPTMAAHSVPICLRHFHGEGEDLPYANDDDKNEIEGLIAHVSSQHDHKLGYVSALVRMLIRSTYSCIKRSIVTAKKNHRMVCFVPRAIALPKEIMKLLPVVMGYKLFIMRGGAHNIDVVEAFHARREKSILFMTYRGGATGFSIDADEVFLMSSVQSTSAYVYQAAKRIERITNNRTTIHTHYVETNIYRAIFSYHAAELSVLNLKVTAAEWLQASCEDIYYRFDALRINPLECSAAIFLFLCNPDLTRKGALLEYIKKHITVQLMERAHRMVRAEQKEREESSIQS